MSWVAARRDGSKDERGSRRSSGRLILGEGRSALYQLLLAREMAVVLFVSWRGRDEEAQGARGRWREHQRGSTHLPTHSHLLQVHSLFFPPTWNCACALGPITADLWYAIIIILPRARIFIDNPPPPSINFYLSQFEIQ